MHAFHLAVSLLGILSSRHMCIRAQRYGNRDALRWVEKLATTEAPNSSRWLNTWKLSRPNQPSQFPWHQHWQSHVLGSQAPSHQDTPRYRQARESYKVRKNDRCVYVCQRARCPRASEWDQTNSQIAGGVGPSTDATSGEWGSGRYDFRVVSFVPLASFILCVYGLYNL